MNCNNFIRDCLVFLDENWYQGQSNSRSLWSLGRSLSSKNNYSSIAHHKYINIDKVIGSPGSNFSRIYRICLSDPVFHNQKLQIREVKTNGLRHAKRSRMSWLCEHGRPHPSFGMTAPRSGIKLVSYQKKDGHDHTCPSFFWCDNNSGH